MKFEILAAALTGKYDDDGFPQVTPDEIKRAERAFYWLDNVARSIIDYRAGLRYDPMPIEGVAMQMAMPKDKVRRIYRRALHQLKGYFKREEEKEQTAQG